VYGWRELDVLAQPVFQTFFTLYAKFFTAWVVMTQNFNKAFGGRAVSLSQDQSKSWAILGSGSL
jgi:hypothetical protein